MITAILVVFTTFLVTVLVYFFHHFGVFNKFANGNRKPAHPVEPKKEDKKRSNILWQVNRTILRSLDFEKLSEEVVNVVLKELDYMKIGYRICVLTLVDKQAKIVRRVSFSPTPEALEILRAAKVRFTEIKIPLSASKNLLVKVIKQQKPFVTHDLSDVFYPEKTRDIWRNLQHKVGIKTSLVFPLVIKGESIGAMIFSLSKSEKDISPYEKEILAGFTDAVAVALENASLYRRLKKTNEKLKEVSALKDEFVSLASHELRTPMTAVSGSISTILDGYAGKISKDASDFLTQAKNEVDRLLRLVNNLLNISRIESGRLKYDIDSFTFLPVVKVVVNSLKPLADEKKLTLSYQDKDEIKVKADKDKLEEVLTNLIGNSIKYTEKGSIKISWQQKEKNIVFNITDTGSGVDPKHQKHLFDKFYRTKSGERAAKGTGLGLYICRIMVEGMGGKIWLKSELGKGSVFSFSLPKAG